MPSTTGADARDRLPALLNASKRGECVTVTRHGRPVAELRPIPAVQGRRVSAESIDWIERQLADLPRLRRTRVRNWTRFAPVGMTRRD
ncbi:type II toxin-antitoxin system Phd/YefM family antitoxin [Roseicella aquatilis]|uniref:Type II toxin-antitoxin system prevent-host-death family antitoxin n=1 Tax=Roseicella aquatilis TaxID=2527868 RepID=A0A4R4DQ68_9PROT|nr:type II toxin-antitoxin system prevent-host-death family antitoxin [Roseicella aquatilis]TCZ63223.1 type II toxin-antitoxin system prevent-host-death family antitoxin [Roseicella aquatilis]